MTRRAVAATVAAFLLGWGLATTFQRAAHRPIPLAMIATAEAQQKAGGWSRPDPAHDEKAEPPPTIPSNTPPAANDPMDAVESFLRRNRDEADNAIESLAREAESLRQRLAKVEAALARWRSVADAIKPDPKAAMVDAPPTAPAMPAVEAAEPTKPPAPETPGGLVPPLEVIPPTPTAAPQLPEIPSPTPPPSPVDLPESPKGDANPRL